MTPLASARGIDGCCLEFAMLHILDFNYVRVRVLVWIFLKTGVAMWDGESALSVRTTDR